MTEDLYYKVCRTYSNDFFQFVVVIAFRNDVFYEVLRVFFSTMFFCIIAKLYYKLIFLLCRKKGLISRSFHKNENTGKNYFNWFLMKLDLTLENLFFCPPQVFIYFLLMFMFCYYLSLISIFRLTEFCKIWKFSSLLQVVNLYFFTCNFNSNS
jgi:hypothetical protein